MESGNKGLRLFLGITLFTQAVTSLVGGLLFLNPFETKTIDDSFMRMTAGSAGAAYASILLQIFTAAVIVMLGVAMYRLAGHLNKPAADVALCMYVAEAVLLIVSQAFVYGLLQAARLYAANGDASLLAVGKILLSCKTFSAKVAMIPFGIGAVAFYRLITRAGAVPKWLGWYGTVTALLVPICVPLPVFGVEVPFFLLAPYVPFEFFAGLYVAVRALRGRAAAA